MVTLADGLSGGEVAGLIVAVFWAVLVCFIGYVLIKLGNDDRVLGFIASTGDRELLTVETTRGAEQTISTAKYEVTGRGGKGRELLQRGQFTRIVWPLPDAPPPLTPN